MLHLHVASQQIKWHPDIALSGYDAKESFYRVLKIYDCGMGPIEGDMDEYTETFELDRSDLIRTRNSIASKDGFFSQHEAEIREALKPSELTPMSFVKALDTLINNGDTNEGWVYVSWF